MHLPVGRHLVMELRSADVIHDWWVPALGNKMDIIPGTSNYISLDINKAVEYNGACSEFCGVEHAWMRIKVIAQNENDFDNWLQENSTAAKLPTDSLDRYMTFSSNLVKIRIT
ncbi:MAG: cytochrome c oxidase subunit II [Chitinophagaceae bacterium]